MPRSARQPAFGRRLAAVVALAAALAAALAPPPVPAADRYDPHDVEAAMLVNVVKFVTWPGTAPRQRALAVCAVAAPRFAAALAHLAARGAPLTVAEVRSPARASGCDVAVLGAALDDELEETAEQLADAGVLTVSDVPGAARRGVHVGFVVDGERVRFEVNLAAARRAHLEISSKLLRLARAVEGGA
jgi:hypothetical protein